MRISTKQQQEIINITDTVQQEVAASDVQEGLCIVQSLHTTASVFCNVTEDLDGDIFKILNTLCPNDSYAHNRYDPNAEAHLKKLLLGRTVTLTITNGSLDLGTWEKVQFAEFDGPRTRQVHIKIIGT